MEGERKGGRESDGGKDTPMNVWAGYGLGTPTPLIFLRVTPCITHVKMLSWLLHATTGK